jgi:Flp pilus assembly protein TadG
MRRVIFHRPHEKGAIAIIVAVLFGFGVMTAAAALTIDVGNINADRRQLQNGADAMALSAAKDCATSVCPDATAKAGSLAKANYDRLQTLANTNAADGATKVARVDGGLALCGTPPLSPCTKPPSTADLQECPDTPFPSSVPYVQVYAQTLNPKTNQTLLPYTFGAAIAGAGTGANQQACAAAAYGPASPGLVLPITFSYCEWQAGTGGDLAHDPPILGIYQPPPAGGRNPGYGYSSPPDTEWPPTADATAVPPVPASELVFYNQGADAPSASCPTWTNHVAPGTFGELPQVSCNATVVDNWVQGQNGNPAPCDTTLLATYKGHIVYVPIFDCYTPIKGSFVECKSTSPSDWYHIQGYAAFYLTGFYFSSGGKDGDSIYPPDNGKTPCKTVGDRCISGWFTKGTLPTTIDTSGDPTFGSLAIQLTR